MDADRLLTNATQATNLTDLGDPGILGPLNRLVSSINTEAKLHDRGREAMEDEITQILMNRLRVESYLKLNRPGFRRHLQALY